MVKLFVDFQRCVLTKLDIMIEKQDEGLSILRMLLGATSKATANTDVMLEDIIPSPVDSVDDLNKLSSRLDDDQEFTKKMANLLNLFFINHYLKGKKSKLPFKDLTICRILIKACRRVHKKANDVDVEWQIAEFLKHAPNKPGGTRYKDRESHKD
ncbi:Hypothetical predicted protein [Paramuricea clavata]|uniref:Uncharacterized protein n=1 Tax=Paramuricea clavata TaxID=317549 RepID=A0A7D9ITR4_PARCT|nr:Hypothetical predicted protein [Paramuricea clavata]